MITFAARKRDEGTVRGVGDVIPAGTKVRIKSINGVKLMVEKV